MQLRYAWAASIISQVLLTFTLWRNGRCDWWIHYLIADLVSSAILWQVQHATVLYYWVWVGAKAILAVFALAAAMEHAKLSPWSDSRLWAAIAISAWVLALAPGTWPVGREAGLVAWHITSAVCTALLFGGTDTMMLVYHSANTLLSALALASPSRDWAVALGTVHSYVITLVFAVWCGVTITQESTVREE